MKNGISLMWLVLCVLIALGPGELRGEEGSGPVEALLVEKTTKSMPQVIADLKTAIRNNNFVFIRLQSIDRRLTDVGSERGGVILVYFCNFNMLSRALKIDTAVGVFVPCKITLIQNKGYVQIVAVNPKFVSQQLAIEKLKVICDQLANDYRKILEEAVL